MLFQNMMVLLLGLGAFFGVYGFYFAVVALAGFCKKQKTLPVAAPEKRFAVVVAARNEEAVIGQLVDSLVQQKYPQHLFEVIVAPNNCIDNTAAVAEKHGATIFIPQGHITGKGQVLEQVTQQVVLREGYDAMCVIDADNLVDENFLCHINTELCNGAHAVQGFRDSKNYSQSMVSGCYSICYWMVNHFYNKGRAALGLSALINGSGFAVSANLLERMGGWKTVTMTEDYEFTAQCALAGERVHFCKEARIYDEQPLTFLESWKQRRRWTTGFLQGMQLYSGNLLVQSVKKRRFICFDLFLTFVAPAVQMASLGIFALNTLVVFFGGGIMVKDVLIRGATICMVGLTLSLVFMLLGSALAAGVTALLQKVPLGQLTKSIATYGVFLFTYTVLTVISFCKKKTTWEPISHTNAQTIAEMQHSPSTRG